MEGHSKIAASAQSAKPVVYQNPHSNHSNLINFFLAATGLSDRVDSVNVSLVQGEHKLAEYLSINPSGQVPALVDGAARVYESSAVLRYLAIKFRSPLFPIDDLAVLGEIDSAYEHVRQKAWDHQSGFVYHNKMSMVFFNKPGDQARLDACRENLHKAFAHMTATYFKGTSGWMVADRFTLADVALGTLVVMLEWANFPFADPKIKAYLALFKSQPWFERTEFFRLPH